MYRVTLSICLGCLSRFAAQMRFSPGGPVQRLAWIHLSMAEFGKQGAGNLHSSDHAGGLHGDDRNYTVSGRLFMNRFRNLGFIAYNERIQVLKLLLNVVLLDQLPEHSSEKPELPAIS